MSNRPLPPSLVANLQSALIGRRVEEDKPPSHEPEAIASSSSPAAALEEAEAEASTSLGVVKPVVLVTNGEGIEAPGLLALVKALVRDGLYDVHVCAPASDKSVSGHSVTVGETLVASSAEINGATAFEISGTPVDCVSLALSGYLFSWSKPALVISGINKGSSYGQQTFYSGAIAAAREALMCGVPSLAISLNWQKEESQETDFTDAVNICLPLINASIRDVEKGLFPKNCSLNIDIPSSPAKNKGFKITRPSLSKSFLSWQAVAGNRHPAASQFNSKHQSLGIQLAQLSRDASAAGAARRINTQRKTVEIESVAAPGKAEVQKGVIKKYFRLELLHKEQEQTNEDLDFKAVANGYVAITPVQLPFQDELDIHAATSCWLASALTVHEESSRD